MKKINRSSQLVAITITMFLLSAIWLSWISKKQMDPDYQKNWWVLSFDDPKSSSLNFTIENHSNSNKFHWEISIDKTKIKEGDVAIDKGQQKTIPVSANNMENKKATITVTSGENKKEIYKSF